LISDSTTISNIEKGRIHALPRRDLLPQCPNLRFYVLHSTRTALYLKAILQSLDLIIRVGDLRLEVGQLLIRELLALSPILFT
jgi:hypothetical protein